MLLTRSRLPSAPLEVTGSKWKPLRAQAAPRMSQKMTRGRLPVVRPKAELISVDDSQFAVGPVFARGAYGSLHRAVPVDQPSQRLVAKKMLVGPGCKRGVGADDDMYQLRPADKIETEIAVMHAVQSPLAPKASEVGEQNATLLMPYRDGDLEALGRASDTLAPQGRRDMLRSALAQSAGELARMHASNYMHLDIKASNMFFNRHGEVCMGDFGLAHDFNPGEPLHFRRGSPAMMAPEALLDKALTPKGETWSLFVTWLDLAVGSRNNVFITEPTRRLSRWRVTHGPQPFSNMVEAEDGPFRTFFTDLFAWRAEHPGALDAQTLAEAYEQPISQTIARALAFDPEMTTLGLEHALAQNPAKRMTMQAYSDQVRALQPADSLAEVQARQAFGKLAESQTACDHQFAALRREASSVHPADEKKVDGAQQGGWMRGLRHALAF